MSLKNHILKGKITAKFSSQYNYNKIIVPRTHKLNFGSMIIPGHIVDTSKNFKKLLTGHPRQWFSKKPDLSL